MRVAVLTWALVGLFFVEEASSTCPTIKRRPQECTLSRLNLPRLQWKRTSSKLIRDLRIRTATTTAATQLTTAGRRVFCRTDKRVTYETSDDGVCRDGICYKASRFKVRQNLPRPVRNYPEDPSDGDPGDTGASRKKKKKEVLPKRKRRNLRRTRTKNRRRKKKPKKE
uniref:Putative tick salivary peptide group 1 n=1 Tax=Ixodes ricinus TaxID=34613 RepID=V5H3F1_IXORI